MQRAVDFKLSFMRMLFGLLILGALLNSFQHTAWQSGLWRATLFLSLTAAAAGFSFAVLLGWHTRTVIPLLAASVYGYHALNHFFFHIGYFSHPQTFVVAGLLILNAGDTNRFFSITKGARLDDGESSERALKLFKWYMVLVYWGCAYAKIRFDFLSGFSLETQMIDSNWGSLPLPFQIPGWIYPAMAMTALGFESILPFFLLRSQSANFAVITAIIFHLLVLAFLHPLMMSFVVPVGLIAFVEDRTISRWAAE